MNMLSKDHCFFVLHCPSQRRSLGQNKMRGCMLYPPRAEHPAATQVVRTSRPLSPQAVHTALLWRQRKEETSEEEIRKFNKIKVGKKYEK
jgi:hypothetical protein